MTMMRPFRTLPLLAAALVAPVQMAHAQTVSNLGQVADRLSLQGGQIGDFLGIVAAVAGIGVALAGLFKFKAHTANPNDPSNKVSSALTLIFTGAAMVAIPELIGTGVSTIFGSNAAVIDTSVNANAPEFLE
ncbi:DUF6750 family protein [Paracoccus litorisediminis]|uniref:DUF6750 family protein n=1 Tax=Paracoccus litorisediminis TaxID=2006130 RepID=UPI0037322E4D